MQRTYSKKSQRRREDSPSPRKRQKVYVEIISPRRHPHSPKMPEPPKSPVVTPKRSPRDPSSASHPPRGSIVKRMLGRSKTESSLEATPSSKTSLSSTPRARLPHHASFHALPTTFPDREPTPEASTESSPKPLPTRNIRTYAGSSRSFLVALPVPDADPLNLVEDDTEPHESYTDLRTRWGIDLSEDDPQPSYHQHSAASTPLKRNPSDTHPHSLPAGMMNDLKSITELRSKGESRRFLDEVGYLFEGLDSSSAIGLRRASALEVVNKLCDPEFNRRAKTSDFYIRTWEKFWAARAGTIDKVLDATIAFFAALAARDLPTLTEVAQQQEFVSTLMEILGSFDHRKDVLASALASTSDEGLKSLGVLRTEITALKSLARLVSKQSESSFANQPSARFFISHSLATFPPSLLADQHLPTLLTSLRAELELCELRTTAYESGLPLFPPTSIDQNNLPSLYHIEACLRLVDSYLLGHWSSSNPADDHPSSGLSHVDGLTSELMSLCVTSASLLEESRAEKDASEIPSSDFILARKCLCGAMRVLTLLSHDDPWWSNAALDVPYALAFVATTAMRSQAQWSHARHAEPSSPTNARSVESFDLLCLALGLVMNWATSSRRVGMLARVQSIDPSCSRSRSCARVCRCPSQTSILACLTALHAQYTGCHHGDDESPECAFLRGYTAILLGLLIKDDSANQAIVTSALPGTSSDGIKSLIAHCRAFLSLYDDTTSLPPSPELPSVATSEETPHEPTGRHRATWDKRGEEIAQGVIASLVTLCDSIP